MAKKIFVDGDMYTVGTEPTVLDGPLPQGVYNLVFHPKIGYYLKRAQEFALPEKIYGDLSIADRYLKTYQNRTRNTGILLTGQKGSGKTILAKYLALNSKLPIICINQAFDQDGMPPFSEFLAEEALGDCFILLDEYDKVFQKGDNNVLTLLDGQYNMHHLIVLTTNETGNINSNLFNRPSRIFFRKDFSGVDETTLKQMAEDLIKDKDLIEDFYSVTDRIPALSFDIVMAIISEVNLYNKKASELVKDLGLYSEKMWVKVKQLFPDCFVDATDDYSIDLASDKPFDIRVYLNPKQSRYETDYIRVRPSELTKVGRNHYTYTHTVKLATPANEGGIACDGPACECEAKTTSAIKASEPVTLAKALSKADVEEPINEITCLFDITLEPYRSYASYIF